MSCATLSKKAPSGGHGGSTTTRTVNSINIALILASFAIALYLPFQLFLFAYAILGPGHYLTEISWLERRRFFTKGGYDPWVLAALALVPSIFATFSFGPVKLFRSPHDMAAAIGLAFGSALVFFLTGTRSARLVGLGLVAAVSLIAVNSSAFIVLLLALFLPTLIHVYVFTGVFMIFGALKERSVSGYLAFGCFLVCPLLYLVLHPGSFGVSDSIVQAYWRPFSNINTALLGLAPPHSQAQMDENVQRVFGSDNGLMVMRFIAFAYTYHYLNWFSKTAIIKWHKVPGRRLPLLGAMWAACIALYLYDSSAAMKVLFCLSFLHVFLEFPLNHMSILGTARELRGIGMKLRRAA